MGAGAMQNVDQLEDKGLDVGADVQEVGRRRREEDRAGGGKPEFAVKEIQGGGRSQVLFWICGSIPIQILDSSAVLCSNNHLLSIYSIPSRV